MTAYRRFDQELSEFLAELYLEPTPDQRHDNARRFAATPQRPAWAFPERWIPMGVTTFARQSLRPLPWRTIGLLAVMALLLGVAIALYAGSQPRLPAPFGPAANGTLIVDDGADIFFLDPITGARTLAIGGATIDTRPVFSRDGTRVAFFRESTAGRRLFVADKNGGNIRQLSTTGLVGLESIDWAPDGSSILTMDHASAAGELSIVPTDGGAARVIDVGVSVTAAVWLPPDGQQILFQTPITRGAGYGLWLVAADGSNPRPLVPATGLGEFDGLFFEPSPDGSEVAYQWSDADGNQNLYVIAVAGGLPRKLTSINSVGPSWSPDGQWIAFSGSDQHFAVRTDGSERPTALVPRAALLPVLPSWSPDGTRILAIGTGGKVYLLDPTARASTEKLWQLSTQPDWQRLALPQ